MTPSEILDPGADPRLLQAAIESTANAIFITDADGEILWANPAFKRLTGYSTAEACGNTPRLFKSGRQNEAYYGDLWRTILAGEVWHGRVTNRHKDGHLYTAEQTVTPIRGADGTVTHFVAIHEDITARLASEDKVAHMALHDSLTDLPNRYALDNRLEVELTRARRLGSRVAALWVDLDNFKDVNDTFGHSVGDALLIAVGRRLTGALREVDMICRLGGDEFAVVMPDVAGEKSAADLAERLLASFDEPFAVGTQDIFVTASVGIAVTSSRRIAKAELMKQSDLALYRAKTEGRNAYRFFSAEMDLEIQQRMRLAQDLHRAVDRGELFLEYQPQVGLADRRIIGAEALVRWQHPELGVVPPIEFIPVAESSGLIDQIGKWVLRTACSQARDWQDRGLPAFPVSVNISAIQLRDPRFADGVSELLAELDLAPEYLELELTERVLMDGSPLVEKTLQTLSEMGVPISLDDFGKGYASLDYLRRYPLSKVKIDQSFVHDIETNFKNATIVSAVIALASKLGLMVIAEGVEPHELLQRLIAEGCEQAQGFYFSKPTSPEDLENLLTTGSDRIEAHPKR